MNGEQENLFDAHLLKTFKVGDLVSWKQLVDREKEYGFIQHLVVRGCLLYCVFPFKFIFSFFSLQAFFTKHTDWSFCQYFFRSVFFGSFLSFCQA